MPYFSRFIKKTDSHNHCLLRHILSEPNIPLYYAIPTKSFASKLFGKVVKITLPSPPSNQSHPVFFGTVKLIRGVMMTLLSPESVLTFFKPHANVLSHPWSGGNISFLPLFCVKRGQVFFSSL